MTYTVTVKMLPRIKSGGQTPDLPQFAAHSAKQQSPSNAAIQSPAPHSKPSNYSLPRMALAIPGGPRFCGVQEIAAASKELLLTLDRLHNCVVSRFTLSRVMESRSCPWGHHKEKLWPQYSDTIISFIVLCQICDQLLQSMSRNALHWYARTTIG